jgi:CHAT domain-containing protein
MQFDLIHFTTHALQDYMAPSQSHILLQDDALSYADIISLRLNARLVVLGSCNGVLGTRYSGDEVMGLAQAFFFAGAQTVIASLWAVEDESTSDFMSYLYRYLQHGEKVSRACWLAQREMAAAGFTPYQWAPFIAIGLP